MDDNEYQVHSFPPPVLTSGGVDFTPRVRGPYATDSPIRTDRYVSTGRYENDVHCAAPGSSS